MRAIRRDRDADHSSNEAGVIGLHPADAAVWQRSRQLHPAVAAVDRLDEAVGCFGRALALNPDNRRARVELAIALLMRGELQEGFTAYETRKRLPETPTPDFSQPAWDGGSIRGKRILLYPEQGLGDVLL